jgi:hypothetical protein
MSNTVLVTRSWVKRRTRRVSSISKRGIHRVIRIGLPLPSGTPRVLRYMRRLTPPVLPTYSPTEIVAHVNMDEGLKIFTYTLREPLVCRVKVSVRGWYTIECDRLDIIASGATMDEAIAEFAMKFDWDYYDYTEEGDAGLGPRMQEIYHDMQDLIIDMKEEL